MQHFASEERKNNLRSDSNFDAEQSYMDPKNGKYSKKSPAVGNGLRSTF